MKSKVKYIIVPFLIICMLFIGLTAINNKKENLKCNMISMLTQSKKQKPAVELTFGYEWTKMPVRLSPDVLTVNWDEGWKIDKFSININGKDVTDKFYINLYNKRNSLDFQLNSNANFLSNEAFKGEIVLIPEDASEISSKVYSSSNMQYTHKGLLTRIVEADSVGWENKTLFSETY